MPGIRFHAVRPAVLVVLLLSLLVACGPSKPPEDAEKPTVSGTPTSRDTSSPSSRPSDVEDVKESPWGEESEPEVESLSRLEAEAERLNQQGVLHTVYFATDRSDLQEEAREILARNAAWLRGHTEYAVVVEGHCDERNTEEYNLALGERRAESVRSYLVSLGVDTARVETISYGEERPVDPRNNEAAWSRNRRAEFVLKPM